MRKHLVGQTEITELSVKRHSVLFFFWNRIGGKSPSRLPEDGRIGGLGKDAEVAAPRGVLPRLLTQQEESDRDPWLQAAADTADLGSSYGVCVDPELPGHLDDHFVLGYVPLGYQSQPFPHHAWLDQRRSLRDHASLAQPPPETLEASCCFRRG